MRVAVFCGSRDGGNAGFAVAARELGRTLARRGVGLVYGGGSVGLMGVVAGAALDAGGEVIGVIPQGLGTRELKHPGLTDMRVTGSMHERKAVMAQLSDAFIAMPGGLGTLDELAEAMTWTQLGIHRKPCGLLQVGGFWDPFLALLDRFADAGFMDAQQRERLVVAADPDALLDGLAGMRIPVGIWGAADTPAP